jgi:uncharacterized membrane protein YqjE
MTWWQFAGFLACVALATCAQSITGFAMALILLGLTSLFELVACRTWPTWRRCCRWPAP